MKTLESTNATDPPDPELARVRKVYSMRGDPSLYSMLAPAYLLAAQQREAAILAALVSHDCKSFQAKLILEVGCGSGFWLREFVRWGARPENIWGIDLLPERIDDARSLCPPGTHLISGNAATLEFPDKKFDLVFQSTMFTSILDAHIKQQVATEMLRVLRPAGIIIWYDFIVNNPRNPNVRGVSRREVRHLFSGCRLEFQRLTLAPPLGRPVARFSPALYRLLQSIKILNTHCLAIIQKPC